MHYLVHLIGQGQIEPDEAKIKAVQDYPRPTTKKGVRTFIGLVGYYRRFVPQFAATAGPLPYLTRKAKTEKVMWSWECEKVFIDLKEALQ